MIYDVIFVWWWASSLFAGAFCDKKMKTLILEKTDKLGTKLLLSWWGRANLTNMNIEEEKDYFWRNKKALKSIFSKYNNWDLISFASENAIELVEEDRWRMLMASWKSQDFLDLLLQKNKENNVEIKLNSSVENIEKIKLDWEEVFSVNTQNNQKFIAKNLVIAAGWRSFMDLWTTWDWYNFAEKFGIKCSSKYRWLCWLTTKKILEEISWTSTKIKINIKYKNKIIYSEAGPLLFTHFWLSGPVIFNSVLKIWEYLDNLNINDDNLEEFSAELEFNLENTPKKIVKFFDLEEENNIVNLDLHSFRSWKEAKVTWWW